MKRWTKVAVTAAVLAVVGGAAFWMACGPVQRPDGGRGVLGARAVAPDFRAADQDGRERTLAEFRGHPVVLYFYPRDGTPGCTREACAFRDAWTRLQATGATVLGVSGDDVASHARFAREHHLPFPLLADTRGQIALHYGVSSFLGMDSRVTFVIGSDGVVVQVYPNVDPAIHADEVIRVLQSLPGATAPTAVAVPSPT